jgi:hypothetical protein
VGGRKNIGTLRNNFFVAADVLFTRVRFFRKSSTSRTWAVG